MRLIACLLIVGALLIAGISSLLPPAFLVNDPLETALTLPGDDSPDAYQCTCDVHGTCATKVAPSDGSSERNGEPGRTGPRATDDRVLAGIVPDVPNPPPRLI